MRSCLPRQRGVVHHQAPVGDVRETSLFRRLLRGLGVDPELRPDHRPLPRFASSSRDVVHDALREFRPTEHIHDVDLYIRRDGLDIRIARLAEDFLLVRVHGHHPDAHVLDVARDPVTGLEAARRAAHDGNGSGRRQDG